MRIVRLLSKVLLSLTALLVAYSDLAAQTYPNRQILLMYPYTAGSGVDAAWRTIAAAASKELGQTVVMEYRAGSAGRNVVNALATAPKDGYMLGIGTTAELVLQGLADPKLRLEPDRDYLAVTLAFKNYQVLLANPAMPFRDLKGLVAYAKANPDKLNLGTGGIGTPGHLTMELFNSVAGIKLTHVPYKGSAAAMMATVAGEVQLDVTDAGSKQFADVGKMIPIATTSTARWRAFPAVPTFQEEGYADFEVSVQLGLIAPPGTSAPIVARLYHAFGAALKTPEAIAKLDSLGMEAGNMTPDEFAASIRANLLKWEPIVKRAGLKF